MPHSTSSPSSIIKFYVMQTNIMNLGSSSPAIKNIMKSSQLYKNRVLWDWPLLRFYMRNTIDILYCHLRGGSSYLLADAVVQMLEHMEKSISMTILSSNVAKANENYRITQGYKGHMLLESVHKAQPLVSICKALTPCFLISRGFPLVSHEYPIGRVSVKAFDSCMHWPLPCRTNSHAISKEPAALWY